MEYITMNMKELEQAKVFEQVKLGNITKTEAAAKLRISDRWTRKKYKRYEEQDTFGLVHKSRNRKSPKRWNVEQEAFLIELLQSTWHGFGPTFAAEKLDELHDIKVSKETIRKAMIRANLWKPKHNKRKHRIRRDRRAMLGAMIQLDGSPHDWFEGRAPKCTLLVFIDDATSKILWLEFAKSESVKSLMNSTKNYIQKHGIPKEFYTDHGSVFHVNLNNKEGDKKTQWERAIKELNINVIHANSPQAKGRVERCNKTMQDRLIKDMRLAGISSMQDANEYLKTSNFIAKHNQKYSVKAGKKGNAHNLQHVRNLDNVFCLKEARVLANDFTIMYKKRIFQLNDKQKTILRATNKIIVIERLDGSIKLYIRNTQLEFVEIVKRTPKAISEKVLNNNFHKPHKNSIAWNQGTYCESRMKPAAPAAEAI